MPTVTSRDGTSIAYDRSGAGPAVILVDGALCFRAFGPIASLAALLAPHLTALPFLFRTAVNSTVLVIAMTYWVMPWLVRLADRWLRPSQLALSGIPKDRSKLVGGSDV